MGNKYRKNSNNNKFNKILKKRPRRFYALHGDKWLALSSWLTIVLAVAGKIPRTFDTLSKQDSGKSGTLAVVSVLDYQ